MRAKEKRGEGTYAAHWRETHPTAAAALLIIQGQRANRVVYMQRLAPSFLVFSTASF